MHAKGRLVGREQREVQRTRWEEGEASGKPGLSLADLATE